MAKRNSYREFESIMTRVILVDAAVFVGYLIFARLNHSQFLGGALLYFFKINASLYFNPLCNILRLYSLELFFCRSNLLIKLVNGGIS